MKQFLVAAALLVGSSLFALLLGEVGARLVLSAESTAPADLSAKLNVSAQAAPEQIPDTSNLRGLIQPSSNPEVVYELRPRVQGKFLGKSFRFNSLGMHDEEVSLEKPSNTVRVVGIGDSVMFGWGVEQNENYFEIVEKFLNSEPARAADGGKRFEFINLGTPGYNTTMEVALLESKGMQLSPDIVVLHFVNNDWAVPQFMERPKDYWVWNRSFLYEVLRERVAPAGNTADLVRVNANLNAQDDVVEQYRYMLGRSGFTAAMERLAKLTTTADGKRIPVIILSGSKTSEQRQVLTQLCPSLGFHLTNVGPFVEAYFASKTPRPTPKERRNLMTVSNKDPHPNALGHRLYAQALLAKLQELQIAPAGLSLPIDVGTVTLPQSSADVDSDDTL